MSAIYNEIDPYAAAWLENLIAAGHIEPGIVDRRSIEDLTPDDLKGKNQAHFFAGIGLWSYALRLAGWPANEPVWTGSCPCQPFSAAGKRKGKEDDRHLWPDWFRLIRQSRPAWIFGEQVSGSAGLDWFDSVSSDLESEGYAVAGADLPACGVGAPHRRQRLYFVAHANDKRRKGKPPGYGSERTSQVEPRNHVNRRGFLCSLGDSDSDRAWKHTRKLSAHEAKRKERPPNGAYRSNNASLFDLWSDIEWIKCIDGKSRPIKPGIQCLVDGYPGRVDQLRATGNAIVPQVAAVFIRSALQAITEEKFR